MNIHALSIEGNWPFFRPHHFYRRYPKNILDEYQNAWDVSPSMNNEKLRSCEQKLIKLDNKELEGFLQQFVTHHLCEDWLGPYLFNYTDKVYASCALLHLIHIFCIPDQEEKIKLVTVNLNNTLHTCTERSRYVIFERYLSQQLKAKSILTEIDLLTGQIDPHHEFLLKLCYWDILCAKNDNGDCKEFLKQNVDYLVSNIEGEVRSIPSKFLEKEKTKSISCTMLLCLLNWNICKTQHPVILQNTEAPASSSVALEADASVNYSCTAYKLSNILQILLSTLSEDDIFTVFNNYLNKMYAMESEITEDYFCTGKIEPYYEFLLKLCHCQKLCNKNDETYREYLRRNADYFVSQIELVVDGNKIKWKLISCTILLCLLKFNMCTLKTTPLMIQNTEIQAVPSDASVADTSTKYSCTAKTIWRMLKTLLSTLYEHDEDEMFTAFYGYIEQIYAMKSEMTEDNFYTGKIDPYQECLLKLCYCEKLCIEKDEENLKTFLRKNADFLVPQIEERVNGNKTKLISYKVLLCLSKWGISNQNTAYTSRENILRQTLTFKAECQDFINENAPFFLSMVGTVMTRNNIPVLNNLCDVLLCISYNEQYFHDEIGAVNKLIKYYATQVGINNNILELIIKLGYKILEHLNDNQELDIAIKMEIDFQNLSTLLEDLFTDKYYNSKRAINIFKPYKFCYPYFGNQPCDYFLNKDFFSCYTKEQFVTRLKELWIDTIKCKVKAIQISNEIRNKGREVSINKHENLIPSNITMSEQNFIDEWEAHLKEEQLNTQKMEARLNEIKMVDEMVKKLKLYEMLVLFMMSLMLIVGTSTGHHKSAKLKKYLSLKYEYATASLYLLWCSGDIEVHPGPSLNKRALAHHSAIERRWIQNISPKILVLLPEHEQSKYKQIKKVRNDREKREHFKTLLKTGEQEKVHVPNMYLAEINAWELKEYQLLHKLFIYRCESETIIASLQDFLTCGGSTNDLTDINVSFDTELKKNEIEMILGKDQRLKEKSQLMVYITRHIAGILIKCAHGKDPDAKCDGLWDLPLKNWPKHIILFDPNNRGKYSKKPPGQKLIPDQELVDMLLTLPQVTIPQKYKDIVDAFKAMRKSKTKQHKEELCSIFKRTTSLEKLDYTLKNLSENGILTEEVHDILTKCWTTGAVETEDDKTQSLENMDDAKKKERPHISINIGTKFITLRIEPTSKSSSKLSYNFPIHDELVPLKTMATSASQTTVQKPSNDFRHKITAKKNLTLSPLSDANPADDQTDSITIPQETMNILNSIITFDPSRQAIFESDIKLQCKTSTQDPASTSLTHLNQTTSSAFQFSQSNQNIAISGQLVPILYTHNQSTTNLDDLEHLHLSATNVSQNLDAHMQVSPTSDMGSSDSISSVNSEAGNGERDQNNTLNEGQDQLTDSDYRPDSSNNCVSKTSLKKRKCIEDRKEMKKRKKTSLKKDKKQKETSHRKFDSSMDNSTTPNINMELLLDHFGIDLDLFYIDDQTFDVNLNSFDDENKHPHVSDKDMKDGYLKNGETQMLNENTNANAYNTNVSTELEKFLHDMINCEGEKMSHMKSYLFDV